MDILSWKWTDWTRDAVFQIEHWMFWKRAVHHKPVNLTTVRSAILLSQKYKVSISNIFECTECLALKRLNVSSISGMYLLYMNCKLILAFCIFCKWKYNHTTFIHILYIYKWTCKLGGHFKNKWHRITFYWEPAQFRINIYHFMKQDFMFAVWSESGVLTWFQ